MEGIKKMKLIEKETKKEQGRIQIIWLAQCLQIIIPDFWNLNFIGDMTTKIIKENIS